MLSTQRIHLIKWKVFLSVTWAMGLYNIGDKEKPVLQGDKLLTSILL